ncbi:hypothetical protein [Halothiobacillus sp.]|uniref:hypothetical protein n=1 Tax=Halothiobacillus sp. TaxID=1891311 RepID=UPI002AD3C3A0|nr:hypothetical protein [Halothiobacillus sp.]
MSGMFIVTFARRSLKPVAFVVGVLGVLPLGGCAFWQSSAPPDEVAHVTAPALAAPKPAAPAESVESSPTVQASAKGRAPVVETTAIKNPVKDETPAQAKSKRVPVADAHPSTPVSAAPVQKTAVRPTPVAVQKTSHADKTAAAIAKPSAPHPTVPTPTPTVSSPPAPTKTAVAQGGGKVAPALDLNSLETRLRETSALGVFTKLALKNQVNDLLDKFRAYYQGRASTTLAQLRQPYDMLIMKVLALIQNGDPPLAKDILNSREAIWSVLADPKKFSNLSSRT